VLTTELTQDGIRFVFTDRYARLATTEFFGDVANLDRERAKRFLRPYAALPGTFGNICECLWSYGGWR
jgi:hypothetical protein